MGRSVTSDRPAPSLLSGTAEPPLNRLRKGRDGHDHRRSCRAVTGGIDTHGEVHVAAALDEVGGLLGTKSFGATPEGYSALLSWLAGFGVVERVGVEGTGSDGAGLARFLARAGVEVIEVDRHNRQNRRRQGKSDPIDAVEAARVSCRGV